MNINFSLLGKIMKKRDDFLSKQRQFIVLYQLIKQHH